MIKALTINNNRPLNCQKLWLKVGHCPQPHSDRRPGFSLFLIICSLFFLSSCFKEKTLAPPSNVGHGQTEVIEMGPDYTDQFFYSLATNTVISHTSRFSYDLMFDCSPDKFHIWLNTAKLMSAYRTGKMDMDSVTLDDTTTLPNKWNYELGEFNPDSNAIGKWWSGTGSQPVSAGQVYLIQLGVDNGGNSFGFVKMKVNDFTGTSYSITYSDFISPAKTVTVQKDDSRNYRYLSLSGTGTVLDNIEPAKTDWDLCFTRYSVFFYAPYYIPYQVTGVLNNPFRTTAYMDSTILFDSVKLTDFNTNRLLTRRDAIGYEWKRFSSLSADGTYTINRNYTYYIKNDDDKLYKLYFFDFSKAGIRGYPSFEYYQLQ